MITSSFLVNSIVFYIHGICENCDKDTHTINAKGAVTFILEILNTSMKFIIKIKNMKRTY